MKILVTGTAGFIGFHLAKRLLDRGDDIVGLDSINDYYDVSIKYGRLKETGINKDKIVYNNLIQSEKYSNYRFVKLNLIENEKVAKLFRDESFDAVYNLAAQAGVRYSLTNPHSYIESNIQGFMNILEGCRHNTVKHLAYASSSSVYGLNESMPFSVHDTVDHPVSLYAATKKANELMAHTYSHLYKIPTTGLRFFTVYGPWGRPDMALFLFTRAILNDEPIDVYNYGDMRRDFTYIDDIVEGLVRVIDNPPSQNDKLDSRTLDPAKSKAPYRIYNIGNSKPVKLLDFIEAIEDELGKKAMKNMLPLQPGDVPASHADIGDLMKDFNYSPDTQVETGIKRFIEWYKDFYGIS